MNKVVLIGRLTKDPELKFTPGNGTAVATFSIAVDRRFKSEGQPTADFIPIVVWGKQAENTANYMSKGRLIGISGRIQTRSYEAKDGTRRYVTEIVAEEVQFLGGKQSFEGNNEFGGNNDFGGGFGGGNNNQPSFKKEPDYGNDVTPVDDDDIPF
ncbi:single-stranded DNA-binding protein [Oceanirhabdus sp. W0125-5]|uniref:single-stranded DNA-binding protein n=1 Tax=Oceanirhabdus sp. W0125-5 TaxID=2999116 RepID=UPI0022F2BBB8|nr:single-stranded DNA-binding protein [Oceanirhabdus sp. W0125-5]WBW97621.1 single-stranded DNA-binding protein [Oceanirhabdus sp. W0125-5]